MLRPRAITATPRGSLLNSGGEIVTVRVMVSEDSFFAAETTAAVKLHRFWIKALIAAF